MEQLIQILKNIPEYVSTLEAVGKNRSAAITGVGQINRSHLIAGLRRHTGRPVIVLCQDDMAAKRLQTELQGFLGETAPVLPSRELTLPQPTADHELRGAVHAHHAAPGAAQRRIYPGGRP